MSAASFRRLLLVVSVVVGAWAAVVAISGGFVLQWGSTRILSSREPRNAAVLALLCWNLRWLLLGARERTRVRRRAWMALSRNAVTRALSGLPHNVGPAIGGAAAVAVVVLGLVRGAPYAGGSDVYGYVSQAHLWATGTLRVEQPFVQALPWAFVGEAVTPLGFRPVANGTVIVPAYSPGLPMLMGLFEYVGGRDAVFVAVPLLAGVAVWATYLMGARIASPSVGAMAALLLASSPVFLFHTLLPMSDVPVTAWWAVALALLLYPTRTAAVTAGLACSAAIMTRPNLLPLAGVLGVALLWRAVRSGEDRGLAAHRALLFAAGAVPGCTVVMLVNRVLWGSVLASGYGPFEALYRWEYFLPNLTRYPVWLIQTHTPILLFAVVAPWLIARGGGDPDRISHVRSATFVWGGFILAVFLSYLFHLPNDGWFWLRYLLPALPPLIVLSSVVMRAIVADADRGLRGLALGLAVAIVAAHNVAYGMRAGVFGVREGERKWQVVGNYIADHLPDRAAFIAKLHTGSVRYYADRFTVRYDWIPPTALDTVVLDLVRLGYRPYIVLEESEEPEFRDRFANNRSTEALDKPPVVVLDDAKNVHIYDPLARTDRGNR